MAWKNVVIVGILEMEIGLPKPFSFLMPFSKFSKRILFTKNYNKTNQETGCFSNQRRFKNLFCDKTLDENNNNTKNYNWRSFPSLSWRVSLENIFPVFCSLTCPFVDLLVRYSDLVPLRSDLQGIFLTVQKS